MRLQASTRHRDKWPLAFFEPRTRQLDVLPLRVVFLLSSAFFFSSFIIVVDRNAHLPHLRSITSLDSRRVRCALHRQDGEAHEDRLRLHRGCALVQDGRSRRRRRLAPRRARQARAQGDDHHQPRYDQYKGAWNTSVKVDALGKQVGLPRAQEGCRPRVRGPPVPRQGVGQDGLEALRQDQRRGFDNQRFAMFCKAALEAMVLPFGYGEDVCFVANDWHSGLVPVVINKVYRPTVRTPKRGFFALEGKGRSHRRHRGADFYFPALRTNASGARKKKKSRAPPRSRSPNDGSVSPLVKRASSHAVADLRPYLRPSRPSPRERPGKYLNAKRVHRAQHRVPGRFWPTPMSELGLQSASNDFFFEDAQGKMYDERNPRRTA